METYYINRYKRYIEIAISRDREDSYPFCRSLIKDFNELKVPILLIYFQRQCFVG